jgi:hypothetical protein
MHYHYWHHSDAFWIFVGIIIVASMFFSYLKIASRNRVLRDLAARGQLPPQGGQ